MLSALVQFRLKKALYIIITIIIVFACKKYHEYIYGANIAA